MYSTSKSIAWNSAARATSYRIYRMINGNWVQQGNSTTSLSRNFTGLASNTFHRFAVRAHNAGGSTWSTFYHGRWTNPVPAAPAPRPPQTTPTPLPPAVGPIIRTTAPAQNISQMLIPGFGNTINFSVTADNAVRIHILLK